MKKSKKTLNNDLVLKKQYIKDLSFENPLSPNTISPDSDPEVNFNIELNVTTIKNDNHELNLQIKSDAKFKDQIIFLLELQYAGVFSFNFQQSDENKKTFVIEGAKILFPFARSIIADITKDGGFNPLIIQPFDFEQIYKP